MVIALIYRIFAWLHHRLGVCVAYQRDPVRLNNAIYSYDCAYCRRKRRI